MKSLRISLIAVVLVVGAILAFYFIFDPVTARWMPQCIFHKFTGLQCMGCGAQRVLHSLLHGEFKAAWEANALIVISLPILAFLIFVELFRTRFPGLYRRVHATWVIITISATLLAWLIIRNILGI